jgi:hypothetical protein
MKAFLLNLLILTCSLVLLTGCKIDGEEEITILSDGSGDIRVHFILPYKAFSKKEATEVHSLLEQIAARHPGVAILENDSCPYGNYCQALKLHISFESALDLERIVLSEKAFFENQASPSESNEGSLDMLCALLGDIDAGINLGGIDYHRELDLSPLFKGKIKDGAILGDAEFRYILNTPMAPDSHNADTIDSSSGRLVWTIPLKHYFDKPFTLAASYAGSTFYFIWGIGILLVIAVLGWLYFRFKRRRKTQR